MSTTPSDRPDRVMKTPCDEDTAAELKMLVVVFEHPDNLTATTLNSTLKWDGDLLTKPTKTPPIETIERGGGLDKVIEVCLQLNWDPSTGPWSLWVILS